MNITNVLYNKYYIIRTGDFATNANKKIIYITLGLGLCFHDYNVNHTMEYYYVMFGSSFIWTLIELFLNQQQIRIIKPMKLNINGITYPLNKYIGITLQGIQEGGVVTIIGLYFGDRFYSVYYQTLYHLLIAYMVTNMVSKTPNKKVLSKRQINTPLSLILMSSATLWNGVILYNHPHHITRAFNMFMSMIYITSIWTYVSYCKEFRQVEVYIKENNHYKIKEQNCVDAFFILGYDVLFEIGIAYITFYNLFIT